MRWHNGDMAEHGIGIIGYGEFGAYLHRCWNQLQNIPVRAASSLHHVIPDDLEPYTEWRRLLENPKIDIIVIATPPVSHAEIAFMSLRAGKHVLVEKPPAIRLEDGLEMVEVAQAHQRLICVDYMLRFNPIVEALKSIGQSNLLGKLQHVSVANYASDTKLIPEHWFWDPSMSGGIFVEHAVHFFDLVSYISDAKPVQVTGHAVSRQEGIEDKVVATVEYDTGLVGTYYHHFYRPGWFERQTYRFGYDAGDIDVEGWIPLTAKIKAAVDEPGLEALKELFPGAQMETEPLPTQSFHGGGTEYYADSMVRLSYQDPLEKMERYTHCVQHSILDMLQGIEDPNHTPRIALESALDSLHIATAAREFASQEAPAFLSYGAT